MRHDYAAFASGELPAREALGYPPFGSLARVIARGESQQLTAAYLQSLDELLAAAAEQAGLALRRLGPAPAPIARLRGEHRMHLQLQAPEGEALRAVIRASLAEAELPTGVRSIVDIDPVDML